MRRIISTRGNCLLTYLIVLKRCTVLINWRPHFSDTQYPMYHSIRNTFTRLRAVYTLYSLDLEHAESTYYTCIIHVFLTLLDSINSILMSTYRVFYHFRTPSSHG